MPRLRKERFWVTYFCGCRERRTITAGPGAPIVIQRERKQAWLEVCPKHQALGEQLAAERNEKY